MKHLPDMFVNATSAAWQEIKENTTVTVRSVVEGVWDTTFYRKFTFPVIITLKEGLSDATLIQK